MTFRGALIGATIVVLGLLGAFVAAQTGLYDAAATSPHFALTYDIIHWVGVRSIDSRAPKGQMPAIDAATAARGVLAYDRVCANCHGAPGRARNAFAEGMNPAPPPLQFVGREWPVARIFQATARGVKMTGMPAFTFRMSDADIWAVAAFVKKLPTIGVQDYRALVTAMKDQATLPRVPPPAHAPDASRGRIALMQHGCASCHAVPGLPGGREAQTGPSLAGVGDRAVIAGELANTDLNLALWIQHPNLLRPGSAMPDMRVGPQATADIIAYLRTLKDP
ncbi:MAG: c-type cytochrome [Rhodoblastus sp.]|nr:c-type cytochrome [Rhodoblastus sp.]MCO5087780.1 c-type cytochrome [Methylobacteriaceae bacterium]